jgi:hypothetical protein
MSSQSSLLVTLGETRIALSMADITEKPIIFFQLLSKTVVLNQGYVHQIMIDLGVSKY